MTDPVMIVRVPRRVAPHRPGELQASDGHLEGEGEEARARQLRADQARGKGSGCRIQNAAEETKAIRVEVYATAASCGERISWELSGDLKSFVAEARLEAHVAAQLWRWRGAGVRG